MQTETHTANQPIPTIRTRNEYYRGDVDCPAEYLILECTHSHSHHAPRGRHDARKGCGTFFVNYTAKHWGQKADWQSTCPVCGRKQRRNKGHVKDKESTKENAYWNARNKNHWRTLCKLEARYLGTIRSTGKLKLVEYEEYIRCLHNEHEIETIQEQEIFDRNVAESMTREGIISFINDGYHEGIDADSGWVFE